MAGDSDQLEVTEQSTEGDITGSEGDTVFDGGADEDFLAEKSPEIDLQPALYNTESEAIVLEPVDPLINEDFTFNYAFQNVLGQTGYGPYVDIYFPTNGIQGDHPNDPNNPTDYPPPPDSDIYDGIRFEKATYAGSEDRQPTSV